MTDSVSCRSIDYVYLVYFFSSSKVCVLKLFLEIVLFIKKHYYYHYYFTNATYGNFSLASLSISNATWIALPCNKINIHVEKISPMQLLKNSVKLLWQKKEVLCQVEALLSKGLLDVMTQQSIKKINLFD